MSIWSMCVASPALVLVLLYPYNCYLVCGLYSETMQKRLLSTKKLTFQNTLDMPQAMDSAAQNTWVLQQSGNTTTVLPKTGSTVPVTVHKLKAKRTTHPKASVSRPCSRCNRMGHTPPKCPFLHATSVTSPDTLPWHVGREPHSPGLRHTPHHFV